jgi:hypothetical protein
VGHRSGVRLGVRLCPVAVRSGRGSRGAEVARAYPIAPACLGCRECALAVRGLSTQSRGRVTREGSLSFTLTLNGTTN